MHSHFTSIVSEAVLYLEPWWGGEKRAKPMMFKEIRTSTWETFSFVFRVTLGYYLPPYVGRSPADGPTLLPDQEHKWHWLLSFVHEKPGCDLSMSGDVLLISTFHGVFWGQSIARCTYVICDIAQHNLCHCSALKPPGDDSWWQAIPKTIWFYTIPVRVQERELSCNPMIMKIVSNMVMLWKLRMTAR